MTRDDYVEVLNLEGEEGEEGKKGKKGKKGKEAVLVRNGPAIAKKRLLERLGWTVMEIGFREWERAAKGEGEEELLKGLYEESCDVKIYVGNLAKSVGEGELQRIFSGWGSVKTCEIPLDKKTKLSRGFAFVTMSPTEGAKCLEKLHDFELDGLRLQLNVSTK